VKYDFLIVGAGFFGSTFARRATELGKSCLVIDKASHIAGAAFDKKWDNGIIVSEYGAHILHTNNDNIWNFLSQFSTLQPFTNKPKAISGNKIYSFPINLMTMHQLWGVTTPEQARQKIREQRIICQHPKNFEEWALHHIGRDLYDLFIYGYTKKQWLKEPKELPISIIKRLPIRFTFEENYFSTKYQGVPLEGYSKLIENMLDGITVDLNVDFSQIKNRWKSIAKHLIYTGPIDEFFDYSYGQLEYNTLRFEHKVMKGDYQGNAVFNYVEESVPYIRSVEHKHFHKSLTKHDSLFDCESETVVSYDFPVQYKDNPKPYYPIRDQKNSILYSKYFQLKLQEKNITFGGRLGEYNYFDIDQTVASALSKANKLIDSN
jgi:UDP-galactopyranose mutase